MKNLLLALVVFLSTSSCFAIEGIYVGVRSGSVGWLGGGDVKGSSSIGYGLDFGVRLSKVADLMGYFQGASKASLSMFSQTISAEFRPLELDSMNVTLGAGPGVYFMGAGDTRFGVNAGATASLILQDTVHLGCSTRYHALSGSGEGSNFWSFMLQLGYFFGMS